MEETILQLMALQSEIRIKLLLHGLADTDSLALSGAILDMVVMSSVVNADVKKDYAEFCAKQGTP